MFAPGIWGTVSDWAVVTLTLSAVGIGYFQLRRVAQANQQQANIARADLMLKIDEIFEGPHVTNSRIRIRTLRNYSENIVRKQNPLASGAVIAEMSADLFSDKLTELHKNLKLADMPDIAEADIIAAPLDKSGALYSEYMRFPYWMETVGELTKKGLLVKADVLDLYDAAFKELFGCFKKHLDDRAKMGVIPNPRFLEHCLWLENEATLRWNAKNESYVKIAGAKRLGSNAVQ